MRGLILFLVIGLVAGWLAGQIMKGRGFGLIGNLIVGVIGSVLGGYLFSLIGLGGFGWLGSLVTALVGAVILLYLMRFVRRAWRLTGADPSNGAEVKMSPANTTFKQAPKEKGKGAEQGELGI